jgi:ribosomal protein S18 acetylase RimI-like enzyme
MVDSYAWWIVIHQKPEYENEVVDLVAIEDERLVGFITIEMNSDVIDIVNSDYGFVWEFGVHRDYRGNRLGNLLIDRAHKIMREKYDVPKSIWFSQDENAQKYYEKLGMKEIERHWQFSVNPTDGQKAVFQKNNFDCWEMRGSCKEEDFTEIKKKYDLVEDDDALSPRLCIGYEYID